MNDTTDLWTTRTRYWGREAEEANMHKANVQLEGILQNSFLQSPPGDI